MRKTSFYHEVASTSESSRSEGCRTIAGADLMSFSYVAYKSMFRCGHTTRAAPQAASSGAQMDVNEATSYNEYTHRASEVGACMRAYLKQLLHGPEQSQEHRTVHDDTLGRLYRCDGGRSRLQYSHGTSIEQSFIDA